MSDLFPNAVYITELDYVLGLHHAATESRLLRNRTSVDKTLDPSIVPARIQLLDIVTDLMVNKRNEALDTFCAAWLAHRNLPIPDRV